MANDLIPHGADNPAVLHALIRKRSEIAGQIDHDQLQVQRLIAELDHIDATIRMFNPAVDIGAIRAKSIPPRHPAFRGEVTRVVFGALRTAQAPLTPRAITVLLMRERGLNLDDKALAGLMVKRVRACLRAHRRRGLIRSAPMDGNAQGWEVVR